MRGEKDDLYRIESSILRTFSSRRPVGDPCEYCSGGPSVVYQTPGMMVREAAVYMKGEPS